MSQRAIALADRKEVIRRMPHYNVKAYAKGWTDSMKNTDTSQLDLGDGRNESNEWYDGYFDVAVGRNRWDTPLGRNIEA